VEHGEIPAEENGKKPHFGRVPLMGVFRPSRGFVRNLFFVWQGLHCISPLPTIRRHYVTWAVAQRNPKGVTGY